MTTTTTRPAFATITMDYRLSPRAADLLGDGAVGTYESALTAALEKVYPDAEVSVDVRLASADESTFDATCETTEGVELKVWTRGIGGVEVGADPEEITFAAQESIREGFRHADEMAWETACEAAV